LEMLRQVPAEQLYRRLRQEESLQHFFPSGGGPAYSPSSEQQMRLGLGDELRAGCIFYGCGNKR
jgi:hypothetical protein